MIRKTPLAFRISFAGLIFLSFISPTTNSGQQKAAGISDAELVMLSVTVRNRHGQNLTGLTRAAFELSDEKQVRAIEFFENTDTSVSIGILIDTSASMQLFETRETTRAKPIVDAISKFLRLGNANNEYFLIAFDRAPRFLTDWTTATALLAQKTDLVQANRDTALYDACGVALEKLTTAHNSRRALILISDGQDTLLANNLPNVAATA